MKLTITPETLEECLEPILLSEDADAIVNSFYLALDDKALSSVRQSIEKGMKPGDAYRKAVLSDMDLDAKEAYASVQVGFGLEDIAALNGDPYSNNPYYRRAMDALGKKTSRKDWTLEVKSYRPYELFVYDEVRPSPLYPYVRYSPLGYFAEGFPYPALSQGDRTYMSLIPHEMNTMAEPIAKAKGRVLAMGLGMGYFPFMASQKDEVSEVVVLERDPSVIALFHETFLPLFDHPEKIRVIQVNDALEYVAEEPFDYLFMDLHHDAEDGLPIYISLLRKQGLAKATDTWIEKALLSYLGRYLTALMQEEADGADDNAYASKETFPDHLFSALHFHLKNHGIASEDDVALTLSDPFLKSVAFQMKW